MADYIFSEGILRRKYAMLRVIIYLSRNNTVMEEGAEFVGLMNALSNQIGIDKGIKDVVDTGYGVLETRKVYIGGDNGDDGGIEVDFLKLTNRGKKCLEDILRLIDLDKSSTD